jgi:hypothetical protein
MPDRAEADEEESGLQIGFLTGVTELAMIAVRYLDMDAYAAHLADRRQKLINLMAQMDAEAKARRSRKRKPVAKEAAHG